MPNVHKHITQYGTNFTSYFTPMTNCWSVISLYYKSLNCRLTSVQSISSWLLSQSARPSTQHHLGGRAFWWLGKICREMLFVPLFMMAETHLVPNLATWLSPRLAASLVAASRLPDLLYSCFLQSVRFIPLLTTLNRFREAYEPKHCSQC